MLGIGERTLYRVIQDWKLQDKIRKALDDAGNDVAAAAKALNMKEAALERKIKKWGWQREQNQRVTTNTREEHRKVIKRETINQINK